MRWSPLLPVVLLVACGSGAMEPIMMSGGTDAGVDARPGPAPLPSMTPLVGFEPLPADTIDPLGSADYDALFVDGAPWTEAMGNLGFFGLNGNWVQFTDRVSDDRLAGIVAFLNAHHLPIGAEMAMISDRSECAAGIEGTVPQAGWAAGAAERIHEAGGALRILRADDPWSSHLLAGN